MLDFLSRPWPWWIAGPIIGLLVPLLLILGNRQFGFSSNLRHICAAVAPARLDFFAYGWRKSGLWNLLFLSGTLAGGFVGGVLLGPPAVELSAGTRAALAELGIHDLSGLVPREVISWQGLLTPRGLVSLVLGGFLVGFGSAWAGGCTSGHAISGLAAFERASLVAVCGFFAGGLLATFVLLPLLL